VNGFFQFLDVSSQVMNDFVELRDFAMKSLDFMPRLLMALMFGM
jgi:hypothetical protein